ncbi:MAG: NAD-dependent epimerase/dehydratase family protein [Bacillota bacterium]
MKLLVLGGTVFLGRHLVQIALSAGHEVTLFNRGRSNPGLFPEAEQLLGDRRLDISVLRGRRWDAVVDLSGYLPREVRNMATLMAGAADHYTFISSLSVYAHADRRGQDESAPVGTLGR